MPFQKESKTNTLPTMYTRMRYASKIVSVQIIKADSRFCFGFLHTLLLLSALLGSTKKLDARIDFHQSRQIFVFSNSSLFSSVIAGPDVTICSGQSTQLTASGAQSYSWSPSTGLNNTTIANPIASPSSTTTYIVTGIDSNGGSSADTIQVIVVPPPLASFSSNLENNTLVIAPGTTRDICFSDNSLNAINWNWTFNNQLSTDQSPCFTVSDTGQYCVRLLVSGNSGCQDSASLCFRVASNAVYSIPNIFTPNADGVNDLFLITSLDAKAINCEIYDRWGVKMAGWTTINGNWDGRTTSGEPVSNGVYYYIITITDFNDNITEEKGFIHLVR